MNTLGGTLSESDRTSKKKYKKLVKRLTSHRDSNKSDLDLSNEDSFCDDTSQSDVSAEDEDLKNYVKDFRKKVNAMLIQVQDKFLSSETNRGFKLPKRQDYETDSERSI